MKSKLGFHVLQAGGDLLSVIAAAKPAVLVTMDIGDIWREIRSASPNTLIIIRPPFDDSEMPYDNPIANSAALFERLHPIIDATHEWADGFAGPNEPDVQTIDDAKRLSAYYVNFARLMHSAGTKVGFGSFGNGKPKKGDRLADGTLEVNLLPHLADGNAACNWTFLHEYGGRSLQEKIGYLFLRHRDFWETMPPDKRRDIVLTELGLSGETIGRPQEGWWLILNGDESDYLDTLTYADLRLQETPYVKGAAVFCWYGFGVKDSYAIQHMTSLHHYIAQGGDPKPIEPEEPKPPLTVPQPFYIQAIPYAETIIKSFETLYLVPTNGQIGWSRKILPAESFGTITRSQANIILRNDLISRYAPATLAALRTTLNPQQLGTLYSLCYNIGSAAFATSTLVEKLNAGNIAGAAEQFVSQDQKHGWIFEKGKILPGLVRRRLVEKELFLSR